MNLYDDILILDNYGVTAYGDCSVEAKVERLTRMSKLREKIGKELEDFAIILEDLGTSLFYSAVQKRPKKVYSLCGKMFYNRLKGVSPNESSLLNLWRYADVPFDKVHKLSGVTNKADSIFSETLKKKKTNSLLAAMKTGIDKRHEELIAYLNSSFKLFAENYDGTAYIMSDGKHLIKKDSISVLPTRVELGENRVQYFYGKEIVSKELFLELQGGV